MDWAALYQNRIGNTPPLPTFPRVRMPRAPRAVAELARLADDPDVDPAMLTRIVETDSELTLQVLKLVNNCSLGHRAKVHSVRRGVDLLGVRRSKMLVMSALIQASMGTVSSGLVNEDNFLGECLERAYFARYTAEALGVDPECAYVAGLLQDLLLPCLCAEHRKEYESYSSDQETLVEFERRTFGWDHAAVTAQMLKSWSFPDDVVCCVLYHHDAVPLLSEPDLHHTLLAATAAAALLPDSLRQEPGGISRLFDLQQTLNDFNFLELAVRVDDQFDQAGRRETHRIPLCDRLGRLAVSHVEQRRMEDNWTERTIGSYTIEAEVGQGAMGVVYRARHTKLRRPAAIKLMKTAHFDPQAIERFEFEAQLTSGLTNPHTVRVYDYGTTPQGVLYYAMEYLKGLSLRDLVDVYGPLPEGRAIHILRQACSSLAEAHSTGLIHRDIKAENIYLTVHGGTYDFTKVLDFGLAKILEWNVPEGASSRAVCGTPVYLAPEAILTPDEVDPRTDIYALGIVAYYLVCGAMPFEEGEVRDVLRAQVHDIPPRPSERTNRPITPELEQIILDCMEKDPGLRPSSVVQLSERLRQIHVEEWSPEAALGWWLLHVNSKGIDRPVPHASTFIHQNLTPVFHRREAEAIA